MLMLCARKCVCVWGKSPCIYVCICLVCTQTSTCIATCTSSVIMSSWNKNSRVCLYMKLYLHYYNLLFFFCTCKIPPSLLSLPLLVWVCVVPCNGKLSREKTFTSFADLMPFLKAFYTKMGVAYFGLLRITSGLWWIHESFLREILYFMDSWKFSPSKVSCYTVFVECL